MITKKQLRESEMRLINFCDEIDVDRKEMKNLIINEFTNLMSEVSK